jgi:hypothetical protein
LAIAERKQQSRIDSILQEVTKPTEKRSEWRECRLGSLRFLL